MMDFPVYGMRFRRNRSTSNVLITIPKSKMIARIVFGVVGIQDSTMPGHKNQWMVSGCRSGGAGFRVSFYSVIGRVRIRLTVAAKTAFATAGAMAGRPGSTVPLGGFVLGTMCVSTAGIASMVRR